ncbi:cell division protein FtsZ [Pikeienuella sp. HZG-20]|uniref:cell division protein FtsZ n=1 Tax=Paludibacillus litoralis TaxID=3133267 RepID=UPI0030EED4DE
MALNLKSPEADELRPRITVFGVGGAGGNAVNNMIEKNLEGAEFVVANTDAQALQQTRSSRRLQLGVGVTQGLGAGARPEIGASAAEESLDEIAQHLQGSHMCFITAGMGGGTGTGAAPVIARAAREMGILTVGVVTKPFQFEGAKRMKQAEGGIDALQQVVDTLIIIPNQNLFRIANERTTFGEAFMMADDVLYQGVKGVTDLMVRPGLINLDFADVRSVMDEMGKAMMGTGEAEGETRAIDAAEKAIANPLLDEVSLKGAKGVLINITGGYDLTLFELDEAANRIRTEVDPEANIIVGSTLDPEMEGRMRVSVVATGIDVEAMGETQPQTSERRPATTSRIVPTTAEAPAPRRASAAPAMAARRPEPQPQPQPAMRAAAAPDTRSREPEPNLFAEEEQGGSGNFIAPAPVEPGDPRADVEDEPAPRREPQRRAAHAGDPTPFTVAGMREAAEGAEADKSRFGLNSLIHRMTGGGGAKGRGDAGTAGRIAPLPAQAPAAAARREPAPRGYTRPVIDERHEEPAEDDEDLRMEIPAFLRRQAN